MEIPYQSESGAEEFQLVFVDHEFPFVALYSAVKAVLLLATSHDCPKDIPIYKVNRINNVFRFIVFCFCDIQLSIYGLKSHKVTKKQ